MKQEPNRSLTLAVLGAAALLSACSGWGNRSAAGIPEAQCHAARATAYLDRKADDATANEAMVQAGAVRKQVLPYGSAARNADVDPQRLNIEVDATGVIKRMRCG